MNWKKWTFEIFWNQSRLSELRKICLLIILVFSNNCLEPKITNSRDPLYLFMNKGVFMFDIFDAQLAFLSIIHSILVQFPKFSFGTKLAAIAILQTIEFTVAQLLLSPMMNNFGF